jgi:hypothetical protein
VGRAGKSVGSPPFLPDLPVHPTPRGHEEGVVAGVVHGRDSQNGHARPRRGRMVVTAFSATKTGKTGRCGNVRKCMMRARASLHTRT